VSFNIAFGRAGEENWRTGRSTVRLAVPKRCRATHMP